MLQPAALLRVFTGLTLAATALAVSACCIPSFGGGAKVTLYEATTEDEYGTPMWYGLLAVEGGEQDHYVKLGPDGGCSGMESDEAVLFIDCWWAGAGRNYQVIQAGTKLQVHSAHIEEGFEGEGPSQIIHSLAVGSDTVKAASPAVVSMEFDELELLASDKAGNAKGPARPTRPGTLTDVKYKYTDVGAKCSMLGGAGEDTYDVRCPGFAGYFPIITRMGNASWSLTNFALNRQGAGGDDAGLNFSDEILRHDPGDNAEVTEKLIEWRYRKVEGGQDAHGLIFRVFGDRSGKRRSKLFVARLEGDFGCIVGTTGNNTEARKIADNMSLRCSGPHTVERGW